MTRDSRGLYDAVAVACRMNGDKRVFPFIYEGNTYFVKQHMKHKRWALRWGNDTFFREVQRMQDVYTRFRLAPEVIIGTAQFMVTKAGGRPLNEILRRPDAKVLITDAFYAAGRGLATLHAGGYVHGRPAARDIIYDEVTKEVAFVDWENTYTIPWIDNRFIDLFLFVQGYFREEIDKRYALEAALDGYCSVTEGRRLYEQVRNYVHAHRTIFEYIGKTQTTGGVDWRSIAMAVALFLVR